MLTKQHLFFYVKTLSLLELLLFKFQFALSLSFSIPMKDKGHQSE